MLSAFLICGEYAITRPTSNALFLTGFSSHAYPWVWLATVPLNFFVVYLYNRFLPKIGPLKMLWTFVLITIFVNVSSGVLYSTFPQLIFFQYAWKDIYVLFMLKQLWSMIHSTIPPTKAKYLYGCIYGMGTIGAISGSSIPAFLAPFLGSERILLFTLPVYSLLLLAYTMAYLRSGVNQSNFEKDLSHDPRPKEAISLIFRSPILIAILLLVVLMQVSVGLMEYRFDVHLERNVLDKDLRCAYCGQMIGIINILSLLFQFIGGFLVVRTLGVRGSHFLIPIMLGLCAVLSLSIPTFAIISFSYVFLKAVDFSLFGVIREMLYVPLQLDAKFRAKAIIDVFAYRTSKALTSLAILLLQSFLGVFLLESIGYISIAVFAGWILTVAILFRRKAAKQFNLTRPS